MSGDWQKHVLASNGYLELGIFDYALLALEAIGSQDRNRNEVLAARLDIYLAAKKWDLAATASQLLVKAEPENQLAWINHAYSIRRSQSIEQAEAILLRARELHPGNALIAFNLACYASVAGRMEEAKVRLRHAIELDRITRRLALTDEDLRPLWDWITSLE